MPEKFSGADAEPTSRHDITPQNGTTFGSQFGQ
jgi:hypothetical protein